MKNIDKFIENEEQVDHLKEEKLLAICSEVGQMLMSSGAETFRVEETVERVGKAVGIPVVCTSNITSLIISIDDSTKTLLKTPQLGGYDLQRIDRINQLSRDVESGKIDPETFISEIYALKQDSKTYSNSIQLLSAFLVGMAPMFVFKATWTDLFISGVLGLIGYTCSEKLINSTTIPYLKQVVGGFVIGFLAILLVKEHIATNSYQIIVSAIMPLVPGVAITNAIREIISNETISGLVRLTNAFFLSGAIGFGVILALEFLGGM